MTAKKIMAIITAICLLAAFTACGKDGTEMTESSGVAVSTVKVEKSDIFTENKVSGQVVSSADASVYFTGNAKCTDVLVKTGDAVEKGEIIARFDPATYIDTSDESYNSTSDQLLVLNMQVDMAKDAYDAAAALRKIGAASDLEVTSAEVQYLGAKMQRDQLLASFELASANSTSSANSVNSNSEYIDSVSGCVYAPQTGIVLSVSAEEGDYLNGNFPLVVVQGQEKLKITTYVSETLVTKLKVGSDALVKIGSAGLEFYGKIQSVDQSANSQTRLYTVSVSIPDDQKGILNGMFADVTFYSDSSFGAVSVPSESVLNSNGTEFVYIVVDGIAKYVEVETGIISNGYTEILKGLKVGDELVTVGQNYLKDGSRVRIITTEK